MLQSMKIFPYRLPFDSNCALVQGSTFNSEWNIVVMVQKFTLSKKYFIIILVIMIFSERLTNTVTYYYYDSLEPNVLDASEAWVCPPLDIILSTGHTQWIRFTFYKSTINVHCLNHDWCWYCRHRWFQILEPSSTLL